MIIRVTYPKAMFYYAEMFDKMYYSRQSRHGGKIISGTCPNAPSGPFSLLRQQSCPQTPTLPRNLVFLKYKYSPMSYEQKQIQKCWNKQQHFKYLLKCNHCYLIFCHQYFHHWHQYLHHLYHCHMLITFQYRRCCRFAAKKAAKSLFCFSLNKGLRSGLIPATICVKFCSRKICFVSLDTLSGDACLTIGIFPSHFFGSMLDMVIIRVKFYFRCRS